MTSSFDTLQLGLGIGAAVSVSLGVSGVLTVLERELTRTANKTILSKQKETPSSFSSFFERPDVSWSSLTKQEQIIFIVSLVLFIGGWTMFTSSFFVTSDESNNVSWVSIIMAIVSILVIIGSIMAVMHDRYVNDSTNKLEMVIGGLGFVSGWLVLGFAASVHKNDSNDNNEVSCEKAAFAVTGSALIIASMTLVLTKQRQNMVVSGPGFLMFAFGWVLVILGKSIIPG